MAIVRGLGSHVGIEISEETTGSAYPYTSSGTWYRVPLLGESLKLERDQYADVNEIGTTGGRETIEFGRSLINGEFTCVPRYDAIWFNLLLAHCMGGEAVDAANYLDRAATVSTNTTHVYYFPATTPKGLSIRVYKAGTTAGGLLETYHGCLVTGFTFEQPEGDAARMTIRFIGHSVTLSTAGGTPAALEGTQVMLPRDIVKEAGVRDNVEARVGSAYAESLNLKSFTLEVDKKVQATDAFITDPDNLEKPSLEEIRDVTLRIESTLEEKDPGSDTGYPYFEYLNNIASKCSIILESATDLESTPDLGHSFRIDIPAMYWESAESPIQDGGPVPFTATARAILGTPVDRPSIPASPTTHDLRLMTFTDDATEYTDAGSGVD